MEEKLEELQKLQEQHFNNIKEHLEAIQYKGVIEDPENAYYKNFGSNKERILNISLAKTKIEEARSKVENTLFLISKFSINQICQK